MEIVVFEDGNKKLEGGFCGMLWDIVCFYEMVLEVLR